MDGRALAAWFTTAEERLRDRLLGPVLSSFSLLLFGKAFRRPPVVAAGYIVCTWRS